MDPKGSVDEPVGKESGVSQVQALIDEECGMRTRGRSYAFYGGTPPVFSEKGEVLWSGRCRPRRTSDIPPNSCSYLLMASRSLKRKESRSFSNVEEQRKSKGSPSIRFVIGSAETIGRRPTMEDVTQFFGCFRGNAEEDYFAVFDGHNGKEAALFASLHLPNILSDRLRQKPCDPIASLRLAFHDTHDLIVREGIQGGATAVVVYCTSQIGYVANVGDSHALLVTDEKIMRLTENHRPTNPEEAKRVVEAGGEVVSCPASNGNVFLRVNGQLGVTRALGDGFLNPFVTCDPYVSQFSLEDRRMRLVLACDGLWDAVTEKEVGSLVRNMPNPEEASIELRNTALFNGSSDNISVVVVRYSDR